jgi:3-hydroxyisobutyrate dehydrogenase
MADTAKPKMAVIGLGSMGFGMATSLRRKGYEVTGCDVAADSVARFVKDGGKGASTPTEAPGQGAAFKMVNQLLAGVHIVAASEAMAFAARQGLDLRKVYEVITASAGNSWMFENRMKQVLEGDYRPRSAVEIFVKDLGIVQDMARNARFPAPVAAAALQMFLAAAGSGMGRDDDASVARLYARISGTSIPGEPK